MVAAEASRRSTGESGSDRSAGTAGARTSAGSVDASWVGATRERPAGTAGLVAPDRMRRADQRAKRVQVPRDPAVGTRLHQHVPERRRLHRTRKDGSPAGVGRGLAQRRVARSAAHEVDDLDRSTGQPPGVVDGPREGGGEAVDDGADEGGPGRRRGCPVPR